MVRFPVSTLGSRMIGSPFETASMPVYVPPPSEYARMNSSSSPPSPSDAAPCSKPLRTASPVAGTSGRWPRTPPPMTNGVGQQKEEKGWKQGQDRFPDAPYVQGREQQDEAELHPSLSACHWGAGS